MHSPIWEYQLFICEYNMGHIFQVKLTNDDESRHNNFNSNPRQKRIITFPNNIIHVKHQTTAAQKNPMETSLDIFKYFYMNVGLKKNQSILGSIFSCLHSLVLGFLYAIFVQWSILATSYPIPPPPPNYPTTHILSAPHVLLCSNTMFLHASHSHL